MSEVTDRPDQGRFEVVVDGYMGELAYRVEDGALVLVHTEVPVQLEGQGIGGHLMEAAVARASRDGLVIAPICPFARRWLRKHPERVEGVPIDWKVAQP